MVPLRLHNTPYLGTCHAMAEEAPQVCEQIGCPLCSLIARIYTEYADTRGVIEKARSEGRDIAVVCRRLARTA